MRPSRLRSWRVCSRPPPPSCAAAGTPTPTRCPLRAPRAWRRGERPRYGSLAGATLSSVSAVGGNSTPATRAQVRLREVDPDFLRFVPEDERQQAGGVMLPAVDLPAGLFEPCELLSAVDGSCGVLVSGMVNRQLQLDDQVALRV